MIFNIFGYIIIHADTKVLTKNVNFLNHVKKIVKKVKCKFAKTRIVFSGIIRHKDKKKNIHKKLDDTNNWLKNYSLQKILGYLDNSIIKEEHLGMKKLHLNKREKSVFAGNLSKYLRLSCWHDSSLICWRELN